MSTKTLVERFQCPGCVHGSNADCGKYKPEELPGNGARCGNHRPSTFLMGASCPRMALGLPKGFCRVRIGEERSDKIRLWRNGAMPDWDHLNVPVWGMEQDGFLFVRTFCPRVDWSFVEVIEGGSLKAARGRADREIIDASKFIKEID